MANVEFKNLGDIGLIHGTISKRTYYVKGRKITESLVATVRNGKQGVRIHRYEHASAPTDGELRARCRFKQAAEQLNSMDSRIKELLLRQWRKDKCIYRGKKYATPRGYLMARIFAGDVPTANSQQPMANSQ